MSQMATDTLARPRTARPAAPAHRNPIVPKTHAPLRTLIIAMSVMCFLSTLAVGTLLLIERAVDRWTSQIAGEITVQITPADGIDADAEAVKARQLLIQVPGISEVQVLSKANAIALLEPWLGRANILEELPIPRLLAITIDRRNPPDFKSLEQKLASSVKNARLDTHRRWQEELTSMAQALTWLGVAILLVIALAAIALVVYATRTALDTNREVIEVLYLVGARDEFIARQIEQRFLRAGLRAGIIGMIGGIAIFAAFIAASQFGGPSGIADEIRSLLLGADETSVAGYALFLLVPVIATLISLVTARLATTRILKSVF